MNRFQTLLSISTRAATTWGAMRDTVYTGGGWYVVQGGAGEGLLSLKEAQSMAKVGRCRLTPG